MSVIPSRQSRAFLRASIALASILLVLVGSVGAQVVLASTLIRTYDIRFQTTMRGSIALIGNTIVTCPDADPDCAGARDGTATGGDANNNGYAMELVDVDGDASTADSSRADLSLPAGATIEFAGLYWGANSASASRDEVRLAVPGASYATVTATTPVDSTGTVYGAFADITATVVGLADPNGTYTVADIAANVGVADRHGGWALVVVYGDPALPLRNLTVFDGFAIVNSTAPTSITTTVSGFVTPGSGTVSAEVGLIAGEGDRGFTGDRFEIDGADVSDAENPADNVFNSTISSLGTLATAKDPDYVNQLGWDVDRLDATGLVANGATSADLTFTTGGETYYPQALTFAVDVFEPSLDATKQGIDVDGGNLIVGDEIEYTIDVENVGNDAADDVVLTDPIPADTTYVPGSLEILTGANVGTLTDAAGDDQGDATGGDVVIRLGTGADATNGGTIGIGETTSIRFRVSIDGGTAASTPIVNQATVVYVGATLGTSFDDESDSDSGTPGDQPDTMTTAAASAPVADDDAATVDEDDSTTIDVLANDTDVDGDIDPTTVTITANPAHGAVTVDPLTGVVTYVPDPDYNGPDTFDYQVCDATGLCATATVDVDVTPVGDPPDAVDDAATVDEDGTVDIDVLANDTDIDGDIDPTSVSVTSGPTHGTVSVDPSTGRIAYTPDPDYAGPDSFTYEVCDATSGCSTATVVVTVTPVTDPPVATDDTASVSENGVVIVDVLANDTDPDGDLDPTTVTIVAGPSHGTVTVDPTTGRITYVPANDYHGPDAFTYQVCDATGSCATATVSVTVVAVPDTTQLTVPPAVPKPPPGEGLPIAPALVGSFGLIAVLGLFVRRRRTD
jgi:large repetitive protein